MGCLKIIIQKNNVPDNAHTIDKNGKFIGITEMSVDILLLCIGAGSSDRGYKAISHFIRTHMWIVLVVSLELLNERVLGLFSVT
jgi:hypothetical protein